MHLCALIDALTHQLRSINSPIGHNLCAIIPVNLLRSISYVKFARNNGHKSLQIIFIFLTFLHGQFLFDTVICELNYLFSLNTCVPRDFIRKKLY